MIKNKPIYSVVDLETTGTDVEKGDRIIQFSCIIVKNSKIIHKFTTKINPEISIPEDITKLTGIKNDDVKHSPTFDEVAKTISKILSNTIFVAHNVNFDFPFLKAELQKFGYSPLNIKAIDTVTMSQLFLPKAPGYRLKSLSKYLNITHSHPHSAESDSLATAHLLIALIDKLKTIPVITLKQILKLDLKLPEDTILFIKKIYNERNKLPSYLPNDIYVNHNLALKKVKVGTLNTIEHRNKKVPEKYFTPLHHKDKLTKNYFSWNTEQNKMSNLIYRNFTPSLKNSKFQNLLIEVPPNFNSSLYYMFSMSYLINNFKISDQNNKNSSQVVISTASDTEQDKIMFKNIPFLNEVLPFKINSMLYRSNNHYIDLNKFSQTLNIKEKSSQIQFIKAKILVWLSITTTGDLNELHLNQADDYFNNIGYKNYDVKNKKVGDLFNNHNFLKIRDKRALNVDFVIMKHNLLIKEGKRLGLKLNRPYLVIDEAQSLPQEALKSESFHIKVNKVNVKIQQIKNELSKDNMINNEKFKNSVDNNLLKLRIIYNKLIAKLEKYTPKKSLDNKSIINNLNIFVKNNKVYINNFNKLLKSLIHQLPKINSFLKKEQENNELLHVENFRANFRELIYLLTLFSMFFKQSDKKNMTWITWLEKEQGKNRLNEIHSDLIYPYNFLYNKIYRYFQPEVFIDQALFNSKRSQFIYDWLDLKRENTHEQHLKTIQDSKIREGRQNLRTYLSTDSNKLSSIEAFLNKFIEKTIINSEINSMVVIFNSDENLKKVEVKLRQNILKNQSKNEILIYKENEVSLKKILSRFNNKNKIILTRWRDWEQIDPITRSHITPQNIVLAELPFIDIDNKKTDLNDLVLHEKYKMLEKKYKDPFYSIALPKTTLYLKQIVENQSKYKHDKVTLTVLDSNILANQYKPLLSIFPKEDPIYIGDINHMTSRIANFLNN